MNSFDISDDEFNIDDSEFAVVNPKGQATPPQSASQRILAQRQQQMDQDQSQRMQAQYQAQQQQAQYHQQPQQQSHYQEKIRQYQEQQAMAEAQHASQRLQAQAPQPQPQQQPPPQVVHEDGDVPIGWAPTKVDSKFDQKELNSIKGAAKQTVMGGHKTQENSRISMGGVDQTESTRMGRDTLQSIRALKHGPAPEPPPKPDSGLMGKIKKLFGGKD